MRLLLATTLGLLVLLVAESSRGEGPKPKKENKRVKALFEAICSFRDFLTLKRRG